MVFLLEKMIEMTHIIKTGIQANIYNFEIGVAQKVSRIIETEIIDILGGSTAQRLTKNTA